jgi:hypothetical protein
MMRRLVVCFGCLLAIFLIASPFALADTVDLTVNNNCGSGCNPPIAPGTVIGTISVTQNGSNSLIVTITMAAGFSQKIQDGNDFNFNGPSGLTISNLNVTWGGANPGSANNLIFGVSNGKSADGLGSFAYNITGIGVGLKDSANNAVTSVSTLTFTVTSAGNITPADLINMFNSQGADFAIHFCDASGSTCAVYTGFAANGGAHVPEPPVMTLLASSVLFFGGFLRRWI